MFHFEELDQTTRKYMLDEVEQDIADGKLYMSKYFSASGKTNYPNLLRKAVQEGDEGTLTHALRFIGFWSFPFGSSGSRSPRPTRPVRQTRSGFISSPGFGSSGTNSDRATEAAETFAEGEFNVYYMRGLCRKLLEEGQEQAEVYRAQEVDEPRTGQKISEGQIISCQAHLDDLRSRKNGVSALGLPRGPRSGLSFRRIQQSRTV